MEGGKVTLGLTFEKKKKKKKLNVNVNVKGKIAPMGRESSGSHFCRFYGRRKKKAKSKNRLPSMKLLRMQISKSTFPI